MKSIKGTISIYYATGEEARLQFIGYNSLKDGFIYSYDEIYDVGIGDEITFTNENFCTSKIININSII